MSTSSPVRDRMKEELQSFFGKLLSRSKGASIGTQDEAPVDEDINSHRDVQSEVGTSVSKDKESEFASCASKSVVKGMDDGDGAVESGLEVQQVGGLGFERKGRYQQFDIATPEQPKPSAPPLEPPEPVPVAETLIAKTLRTIQKFLVEISKKKGGECG